jgi:hypothetical protein
MTRKWPLILAVVLVIVGSVSVALLAGGHSSSNTKSTGASSNLPQVSINCIGGSEKKELMEDPQLLALLSSKYHLKVSFQPMGSYEQVQLTTSQLREKHVDCLWPSSESAQLVFERLHHTSEFSGYKAETVLQSPEVIYAGPDSTKALEVQKVVERRANRYFIVNMKRLLLDYILKQKTWESLGAENVAGPITISSTDPAKSNSGFTLTQLELTVVSTNNVYSAPTLAQAEAHLQTVRALYNAQGLQASSSDSGFEEWLLQGAEEHAPLYAGYENQIIQKVVQYKGNEAVDKQLLESVRILYPEPTIYADHPILALDANAGRLIEAMKDPEVQKLAWERYGFRSGTQFGINNVADFKQLPLAEHLRTTAPPNAEVTLKLLGCIQNNQCS